MAALGLGPLLDGGGALQVVAARLSVPQTLFLLDYVRPDLLMLRVVARSLVLWTSELVVGCRRRAGVVGRCMGQ
jgi:hypothetical protein